MSSPLPSEVAVIIVVAIAVTAATAAKPLLPTMPPMASTDIPSIDIVWWPQPPQFLSLPLLVDCCLSRPCQRRHVVVLAAVTVAVAVDVVILIVLPVVITIAGFS